MDFDIENVGPTLNIFWEHWRQSLNSRFSTQTSRALGVKTSAVISHMQVAFISVFYITFIILVFSPSRWFSMNDKNISVAPWTDSWEQPRGGGGPCLPQRSWTPWPQRAGGGFWILNLMILIRYAPKKRIFPKYYERLSLRVECSCSQLGRSKAWRLYICNSQYHNDIITISQQ